MTKRVLTLVVSLLLFLSLASAQDLVTADRIGLPDAPNTLTFAAPSAFTNSNTTPAFAEGYTQFYEDFAAAHPNWRIDIQVMSDNIGQEQARLLEQARAGRAPDCAAVDSFQLPLFIFQGVLKPVTEFFTQDEIDSLFPFVREGITGPGGDIFAWWFETDLRALYRRTDLVPDAPQTWDELIDAALAAEKQDPSIDGFLFNGGRWEGTTFDNLAHFWSQGGRLLDDTGAPVFAEEPNRSYLLNELNFLRKLVESGASPQRVATIVSYNDFNTAAQANAVAMFLGGHWQYFQLKEALSEEQFAKWEVSPIPGMEAGQGSTGTGGWTIAAFSDDPTKVALCMEFVRSIYMGPVNSLTGSLPTMTTLFDSLDKFKEPIFEKFRDFLKDGRARPGFPIYPELSNQFQIMIGEVLSGTKASEQALEDAAKRVDEAFARQQAN